ncbi:CNH domain-containing protein [Lentinula raphanica]|nr:CNH domain-containing protein [Lentinula raphanica]
MENKRPSSPVVVDQDLQRLYDQVWAGFESEDTQSVESSSSYEPSTFSAPSPRDGVRRQGTAEKDREDIGRIYSVYATDASSADPVYDYGSPATPTSAYSYHQNTHDYSSYALSPISPVSTAAATYSKSVRSASTRSNGRERSGSGSARRLPLPPTSTNEGRTTPTQILTAKDYQRQGHVSTMSSSSINSIASSRRLPATPSSAPVMSPSGGLDRLGVGLPISPRPNNSPSPTRGRVGDAGPYLTTDYLDSEASSQLRRNRSRSPYQTNRVVQIVSGTGTDTSPARVSPPLPPSPQRRVVTPPFPERLRNESGANMNRWNSTTSSIVSGVNAQGQPIPPPPPPGLHAARPLYSMPEPEPYYMNEIAGPSNIVRRPTDMLKELKEGPSYNWHHPDQGSGPEESSYDWDEPYWSPSSQSQGSSRRYRKQNYEYSPEGNDNEYFPDEFINFSLLSHLAIQLRDHVPRGVHVKASIPYEGAFTGKDIVDTVQSLIRKHLLLNHSLNLANAKSYPTSSLSLSVDRRAALHVARSLHSQLLFYEVDGGGRELNDGVEEVYMFFAEDNICSSPSASGFGNTSSPRMTNSTVLPLPTAVVTMLTRCYVPTCVDDKPCYAWDCPKRGLSIQRMLSSSSPKSYTSQAGAVHRRPPSNDNLPVSSADHPDEESSRNDRDSIKRLLSIEREKKPWKDTVPSEVLSRISDGEVNRQTEIHDLIAKETDYLADLITLETQFMLPLSEWVASHPELSDISNSVSSSSPPPTPLVSTSALGPSIPTRNSSSSSTSPSSLSASLLAFNPALQNLRPLLQALITAQTRLLESLRVRARESQYSIIGGIGDLYLERAASQEWRAGWGGGWVKGKGFVSTADRAKEGWTGGRGYDEWVGVWATCGLGGLGIFSSTGSTDEWGNDDWKKIVAEQQRQKQQQSTSNASDDESLGEMEREAGGLKSSEELPDIDLQKFTELLALPAQHLKAYPSRLSAVLAESSVTVSTTAAPEGSSTPANSTSPAALKSKKKGGKDKAENPDASYLREAIRAMRALWGYGKVKTFQLSMNVGVVGGPGKGGMGEAATKWEWFDLVSEEEKKEIGKKEMKRQAIIFELIKGEMAYVKDLENVEHMYITPLVNSSNSSTPIIAPAKLNQFISTVFNNISSLHSHHLDLLQSLFHIQYEEHPTIRSISTPILDAALNWREAYMEYIPNYPIAAYTIDSEMRTNPAFNQFVQQCTRHPDAHRLDMKNFINRPIPRLLRYELLLKSILDETFEGPLPGSHRQGGGASSSRGVTAEHEDYTAIPQVLDVIRQLGKDTEPGVVNAKSKVELWQYNEGLVFNKGEWIDMDLLDEKRSLIHRGKLLRQADGLEWNGWTELFVLLFDNYLVLTKPKEREDGTKYHVNRRPIPLDLLTIDSYNDPPVQRGTGPALLRGLRSQGNIGQGQGGYEASSPNELASSPESGTPGETSSPSELTPSSSTRLLYPITLHHLGRLAPQSTAITPSALIPPLPTGPSPSRLQTSKPPPNVILYAESAAARAEWGAKLQEALVIRRVVQESNKVFEIEMLSSESFVAGVDGSPGSAPPLGLGSEITGRVTCSVPFNTADGRGLVAVGCAEGVWIGFRHDPNSMRRVLHLKFVTQCAMLEDYGIFLVLADKSLFAYHIEALVPSTFQSANTTHVPQKLNGKQDVHFFTVGTLHGRTLVIYMKKKGLDSIFRVLEPVSEKIKERTKASAGFGSRIFARSPKSEWFKIYRDFFLPSESYDLVFLKARIAILCSRGFEIMDLNDFKSVTIPQHDDPRLAYLAKRCESCRPIGMFKSGEDEFLLCYNEFGIYVDKHGDPNRPSGTIEWEGNAERVAVHAPYVLLFDSRFIEIRHLETGRLVQIIPGNDIRCIWDGRGISSVNLTSPSPHDMSVPDGSDEPINQDAQVHAVMNAPDTSGRGRMIVQQVFELLPTVPLFLPDSAPNGSAIGNQSLSGSSGSGSGSAGNLGTHSSVGQSSNTTSPPHFPQPLRNSPSWS